MGFQMICPHCGCGSAEPVASALQRGEAQAAWLKQAAELRPEQRKADQQAEAQKQAAVDLDYAMPKRPFADVPTEVLRAFVAASDAEFAEQKAHVNDLRARGMHLPEENVGYHSPNREKAKEYAARRAAELAEAKEGASQRISLALEVLLNAQNEYTAAKAAAHAWARKTGHLL